MIRSVLNRMLMEEPILAQRLQRFAGKSVAFVVGIRFCWQISAAGTLAPTTSPADAVIRIPPSALPLLLADRTAFHRSVYITGDTALGVAFSQVLTQLPWDAEDALSRLVGDVLARRLVRVGKPLLSWPAASLMSLLSTLAEYTQHESGDIVGRAQLMAFCHTVEALRTDTDRLEKRIARLLTTPVSS